MNCHPGDLAFIVNATGSVVDSNVDRIVRVIERDDSFPGLRVWRVASTGSDLIDIDGRHVRAGIVQDANLRPIRGEADEIREITARELDAVGVTTEHGVVLWPK